MHPVLFHLGSLLVPTYGVVAACGVLLALILAEATARRVGILPRHAWNMVVLAVFSALAVSRLLLIVMNLSSLRRHPAWLLAVAMIHHPLLIATCAVSGLVAMWIYARWARLPVASVADCLAAPVSLGIAFEQLGALLAGSDYGRESASTWSVTYTSELGARWSGTPLGVPLYPVQAYAAIGALLLAVLTFVGLYARHRSGDVAGVWLIGSGVLLFITELFRDWEARGVIFATALDAPQLVGLACILCGGAVLINWHRKPAAGKGIDA